MRQLTDRLKIEGDAQLAGMFATGLAAIFGR
jgi:hypothetical protein